MRCPGCRKEIAFEAIEHAACGWKIASRQVVARRPLARNVPVNAELRAELDRLLKRFRSTAGAKLKRDYGHVPTIEEVTPGHGKCWCELCFPKRVKPPRSFEKEVRHGKAGSGVEAEGQRKEAGYDKGK
jgi:hypothetical protein